MPTWTPKQWTLAVRPRCKVSDLCIVSKVVAGIWSYTETYVCTCTPVNAHLDAQAVDPGCESALQGERSIYCVTGGCWDLVIHIYMHVYTRAPVQAHLDAPAVGPGCEAALQGERSVYCVTGGC